MTDNTSVDTGITAPNPEVLSKTNTEERKPNDNFIGAVYDVPVKITAVLGKTKIPIGDLVKLGRGSVLSLDKRVGEPVDLVVNDQQVIARGEIILVEDTIGITITELLKT